MEIIDNQITSLKKLFEIIEENHYSTPESPNPWLFRGQSNIEHDLIPSVGRLLGKPRFPTIDDVLNYEKIAFRQFEIATYHELKENNPFILLAIAQHHGLKTRFLDWTFSPLVALFFAVESENHHHIDGAIYAYQNDKDFVSILKTAKKPFDLDLPEYSTLYIPSVSPRIQAQSGVFTLFKNPTVAMQRSLKLEKYIIPAMLKSALKVQLIATGISYQTLFPDMDGISKHINYTVLNEKSL